MKSGRKCIIPIALALWTAQAIRADATIRYQTEVKPSAALGPLTETFAKAMQPGPGLSVQIKGSQAYATSDNLIRIFDFGKQTITLADPAHKTYATFPMSQFEEIAGAAIQLPPEQAQAAEHAMASIKSHFDSRMTGKTAEIQGVQAEERQLTVTIDMPMPAEMSSTGSGARIVMHIWTAKKEEALRVPAIRELTLYNAWQRYVMNPVGLLQKVAGKAPGMSGMLMPALEETYKNPAVILRTQIEVYLPFLATLAKQMAGQSQAAPAINVDPDAPVIEMTQEVAELSTAPVDASLFEIPKDYAAVPAGDLIRDALRPQPK